MKKTSLLIFTLLLFTACSSYKSPDKSIRKFLSLLNKQDYQNAVMHTSSWKYYDSGPSMLPIIADLAGSEREVALTNKGTYSCADLEFKMVNSDEKWLIETVIHPELTVWEFLNCLIRREFTEAKKFVVPEVREEFGIIMSILASSPQEDLDKILLKEFSITDSYINGAEAVVHFTADGEDDMYSLYNDNDEWLIYYPVTDFLAE